MDDPTKIAPAGLSPEALADMRAIITSLRKSPNPAHAFAASLLENAVAAGRAPECETP